MTEMIHLSPDTQRIMRLGWMAGRAVRRDGWEKGKKRYFSVSSHIIDKLHQEEFISSVEASMSRYLLKFCTGMLVGYATSRKHR